MREQEDHGGRIHRRIGELLPWYVNGSLAEREREQVEAHLAGCGDCRAEEAVCRRLAEGVSAAGEAAPSPHPAKLRRLLDRIGEEERAPGGWLAPLRSLLQATPRPLRGALAAQGAVILLLLGLLAWSLRTPAVPPGGPATPAAYRTLSSPAVRPARVLRLRVMFSPRTTEKEIREVLQGVHGEIVAGPSPLGVYTVDAPAGSEPAGVLLAHLRTEPQVVFAEPESSGR
jgi:anti-sigma factor RsiW